MLSLQGAWVRSLVGELTSHELHGAAKKISRGAELCIVKKLCIVNSLVASLVPMPVVSL